MRFEEVAWREEFDGIWACASLLHVSIADFPSVAAHFALALRSHGAWYMSFKLGQGERSVNGRTFMDQTEETLQAALNSVPVLLLEIWRSEDVRPRRTGKIWINAIAQRRQP